MMFTGQGRCEICSLGFVDFFFQAVFALHFHGVHCLVSSIHLEVISSATQDDTKEVLCCCWTPGRTLDAFECLSEHIHVDTLLLNRVVTSSVLDIVGYSE